MHYITDKNLVDRSAIDLWTHPGMRPLFPDRLAEGARYFRKTGMFPINHGMAIKREIAELGVHAIEGTTVLSLVQDERGCSL